MRNNILVALICLVSTLLSGCLAKDENPDWNPSAAFPSWTYDAPFYHEPALDLKPETTVGNNIPVYYTRNADFFIRHPNGWQQNLAPQVAIWYSNTCGEAWLLDGYYGLEQRYFIFHAEHDGHYWIRFVGPAPGKDNESGQGVATVPPGQPHEIYVVDTHAPAIDITVTPSPWEDEKRTVRHIYHVGDSIELQWSVADMSLLEDSISLGTAYAKFPNNVVWSKYKEKIAPVGKMTVTIPPEACKQDGIRFRMLAEDRAKNVGIGMTEILHVAQAEPPEGSEIKAPEKAAVETETKTKPEEDKTPKPVVTAPEPKTRAVQPPKVHPAAALIEPMQVVEPRDPRRVGENEIVKPRSRQTNERIARIKPASDETSERATIAAGEPSGIREAKKLDSLSIEALLPDSFGDSNARPTPENTPEGKVTTQKSPLVQTGTMQSSDETSFTGGLLEEIVVEKSYKEGNLDLIEIPLEKLGQVEAVASAPTPKAEPAISTPAPQPQLKELTIEPAPKLKELAVAPIPEPKELTVEPIIELKELAAAPTPELKELTVEPIIELKELSAAPTPEPAPKKDELITSAQDSTTKPEPITAVNASSGWNLSGQKLQGGTNRLFAVQSTPELDGKTLQLQFSSDGGNKWTSLKDDMKPGRTIMWAVPSVDSDDCRLRILSMDSNGTTPLAVSPKFGVVGDQMENAVARVQK